MIKPLIAGAILMGSWAIALFFFRFYRQTRDRLFACFGLAFLLFGIERLVLVWTGDNETHSLVHVIRLAAFFLIVYAIINKNRENQRRR